MLAEIITIGDEILIGQIVDTNSAWMGQKLSEIGVRVQQITSISDEKEAIIQALSAASERVDLVLITGGLGPTKDDITKKTLAEYFNVGFKQDAETLSRVTEFFKKFKAPLLPINIAQADVPENCTVLQNKNGTAPGMWFEQEGSVIVSMPGVPFEMKYLMEEEVLPRIKQRANLPAIVHHTLLTAGIGESFLSERIAAVENALPSHIGLAYLPKLGQVRLRLTALGTDKNSLEAEVEGYANKIKQLIGPYFITDADLPFEKVILDFMETRKLKLVLAESCTGGYLAHQFTQHAGCSSVFDGSAVAYSYDLKESMLGVKHQTLQQHGAVSAEVVEEMAQGAVAKYHADYAVSISGIAGPGGGMPEKPVGTVWIAVANKSRVISRRFEFGYKRKENIERSAANALLMLYKLLTEDYA
ncbi:MAG: competence/damage-inducible protein A [Sphingobacteriaceae bacterium]